MYHNLKSSSLRSSLYTALQRSEDIYQSPSLPLQPLWPTGSVRICVTFFGVWPSDVLSLCTLYGYEPSKPLTASDAAGYSNISWAGSRKGTPKSAQVNFRVSNCTLSIFNWGFVCFVCITAECSTQTSKHWNRWNHPRTAQVHSWHMEVSARQSQQGVISWAIYVSGCNLSEPESLELQVTLHGPFVLPDISWEIGIELLTCSPEDYPILGGI